MHKESSALRSWIVLTAAALALVGCAWLQRTEPPRVTLVGVEPAASEGDFEARMQLKLRVENPNDTPIDYNGISLQIDVQGRSLASGVSNQGGRVPAFGEALIAVPVTVSVWSIAGQAVGLLSGKPLDKISYTMHGKLGAVRFNSQGELNVADLTKGGS